MKLIRSRDNPQFKLLARLASGGREGRSQGLALLDGEHLIEAHAQSGGVPRILVIGESALAGHEAAFEAAAAEEKLVLSDALLRAVSPVATPTGMVAAVDIPDPQPFAAGSSCLMLEGIQDPGNLGSMLRTAAAAGLKHVFLSRGSAHVWGPKALRGAMGAHFVLALHEDADLVEAARSFKGQVLAAMPRAPLALYEADLRGPTAWIFGSEGAGIGAELLTCSPLQVRVPMAGATESLNVAASLAVCLFEQVRQQALAG